MKMNNKMIGSRMTRAALLLGVLSCAQNLKACWTSLPQPCVDYFQMGNCSGENQTYIDVYVTGASFVDTCANAGNHTNGTSQNCDQFGPVIPCTYTIHIDFCNGRSSDTSAPPSTANEANLFGTCS